MEKEISQEIVLLQNRINELEKSNLSLTQELESVKLKFSPFKVLAESNLFGVVISDFNGNVYLANDEYLRIIGYTREELESGKVDWEKITPKDSLEKDYKAIEEVKLKGYCNPFEKEYIRKDGKIVTVLIAFSDYGERKDKVVCFVTDLTESKEQKKILSDVESRWTSIFKYIADNIFTLDRDGTITLINRVAEGLKMEDVIGKCVYDFQTPKYRPIVFQAVESVFKTGKSTTYETEIPLPIGNVTFSCLVSPQLNNKGKIIAATVVSRDITKQKNIEKELIKRNAALKRSNEDLKQFAYVASHDLHEPLRKIQAFSDLLFSDYLEKLDTTGQDYINRIHSAVERMENLINALLNFSRVSSNEQIFSQMNLNQVVDDVVSDLEILVREKNAKMEIEKLPTIEADSIQIYQLFQNLISNALKFAKVENKPSVKIYSKMNEAKTQCQITIEDNGIGFDEKYLDRIFKVFQRLHSKSEYEGTGIGLAICTKIIEKHNGKITAKSTLGEGSKFILTLPIKQEED